MTSELFSPERLELARQRRGLFKQELAARVGVSVTAVSQWENGKAVPSDGNIEKISVLLGFPKAFFFGDAPPELPTVAFRSLARMTAKQKHMAVAAGRQAVMLDEWIEEKFRRPVPDIPDLRDTPAEQAAEAVRAAWGVGYRPIGNLVHLLEAHGVRVYSLVHEGLEVDAFADWLGNIPFIFLNTTKTAERSRMDAAHELGHLVLHAHIAGPMVKKWEDEAQQFASAFLMPRAPFVASAPRHVTLPAVIEAKQRWGVSALAYVHRLYRVGRLTEWQYQSLCIQIKSTHSRSEPGPALPRETSQVLAKVFARTSPNRLTRLDAACQLNISPEDLDQLTFGLTLTPMAGGATSVQEPGRTDVRPIIQLMK